jgi:hypothetical protein
MGLRIPKPKNKRCAPAIIYFLKAKHPKKGRWPCAYAQCMYSGTLHGPTWSHSFGAITRLLSELTVRCDCGRPKHRFGGSEGQRVRSMVQP